MADNTHPQIAYGPNNPIQSVNPKTVIALRDPLTTDFYPLSTLWINKSSDNYFILTSITANTAVWKAGAGGGGDFTSITVNPGNITAVAGNIVADAGDIISNTGDITATAGIITAGNGFSATGGDFTGAPGVNLTLNEGDISVLDGDVTVQVGDIIAGGGNILVNAGIVSSSLGFVFASGGPSISSGAGAPALTAPQGSIYLRTDGTADTTLYVNTDGATAWTPLTST